MVILTNIGTGLLVILGALFALFTAIAVMVSFHSDAFTEKSGRWFPIYGTVVWVSVVLYLIGAMFTEKLW